MIAHNGLSREVIETSEIDGQGGFDWIHLPFEHSKSEKPFATSNGFLFDTFQKDPELRPCKESQPVWRIRYLSFFVEQPDLVATSGQISAQFMIWPTNSLLVNRGKSRSIFGDFEGIFDFPPKKW